MFTSKLIFKLKSDKEIKIEVCGDLDDAKRFNLNDTITLGIVFFLSYLNFKKSLVFIYNLFFKDDDDSDSGEDENENENYKKKKSKSKLSKKKSSNREKLFTCYPLSCKVAINVNC